MINFPLFVIRDYMEIMSSSTGFKIIQTAKNKYVLDYIESDEPSFARRRAKLLSEKLPYTIYPIRYVCYTVQDMLNSGKRLFIDNTGKILRWAPKKYYKVVSYPITSRWQNESGNWTISNTKINARFEVPDIAENKYMQIINLGKAKILYSISEVDLKTIKRKF